MHLPLFGLLALSLLIAAGCSDETTSDGSGGDAASGGSGAQGAAGANGGANGGSDQGCTPASPCTDPSKPVCLYDDEQCGAGDDGRCVDTSMIGCSDVGQVCGCDGMVYDGSCAAYEAGVSLARASDCALPPGHFICGSAYCDLATEYCIEVEYHPCEGDPPGGSYAYCETLPDNCDPATACDTCLDAAQPCISSGCNQTDGHAVLGCFDGCFG